MTTRSDIEDHSSKVFQSQWTTRKGQSVPEPETVAHGNDAVELDGVVLYADLAESTHMVMKYLPMFAAEVYKSFLYAAAKVIRSEGGAITAYDGDRVMGVFIGESKNTVAARCALKIRGAVHDIVQPALKRQYPATDFNIRHKVGIDTSPLFVARTGIRGTNDLVWVGRAANYAAKLAAMPTDYSTYITADVYNSLDSSSRYGQGGGDMWSDLGVSSLGIRIYGSNWYWSV